MPQSENLVQLRKKVNALFLKGRMHKVPDWKMLAEETEDKTAASLFPILETFFEGFREWIGPRQAIELDLKGYLLNAGKYEKTIRFDELQLEEGIPSSKLLSMEVVGRASVLDPSRRVWELLTAGLTQECFDGQPFFSATHPNPNGNGTFSNILAGGAGDRWWLLDLGNILRPFVVNWPIRPRVRVLDDDRTVIETGNVDVCADYRAAYGYTFPQLAMTSVQTLDAANFTAARVQMKGFLSSDNKPLGARPTHLVVGASNIQAANELVGNLNGNGGTNGNANAVTVIEHPFL